MHDAIKNLRGKDYNPCGDLTGHERTLCDEATKNFYNLPFVEVMRALSVKALAALEREENFRNVDALIHWASYNLSDDERRANLNFDTFTPLQAGLAKYLVHVLYENRYNIHYNALVNYCRTLDDKAIPSAVTGETLEREINSLAQRATHSSAVNDLIGGLWNFLKLKKQPGDIRTATNAPASTRLT